MAIAWLLAGSCQGSKTTPDQESTVPKQEQEENFMGATGKQQAADAIPAGKGVAPQQVPPGACRLVGKVVAVLPERDPDPQAPCGQEPCRALVRIQQIIGYGAAFQPPLAAGQEIKVYFTFTLSPSSKHFPELTNPLPGLAAGSIFQADITGPPEPGSKAEPWFRVSAYTVRP